jgi:hypothetical protein
MKIKKNTVRNVSIDPHQQNTAADILHFVLDCLDIRPFLVNVTKNLSF